jgi:N-acetylmuramoyl-L-alanine amidase
VFSNESGGGGRRGPLLLAAAVALAACLAGWLAFRAAGGSGVTGSGSGAGRDASARTVRPGGETGTGTGTDSGTGTGTSTGTGTGSGTGTAGNRAAGGGRNPSSAPASPSAPPAETLPLAGRVIVLDPGHNPGNFSHPRQIARLVDVGNGRKECDTTGTATDSGYREASYTLDVARRVRALLAARGATVTLTQNGDRPYGPCVDERAAIGDRAHADAALSIHADGGPASGRGFHVIAPAALHAGAADTRTIAGPSYRLATTLRAHFAAATGEPFADYLGGGTGLTVRDDLGGLNLSTVPKVFIECGNMRNQVDARALTDPAWRQQAARGIADGLTAFLQGKR